MLGEIEGLHLESEEKRQSFLLKKKKNAYKEKSKCSGTVGSGKKKKIHQWMLCILVLVL